MRLIDEMRYAEKMKNVVEPCLAALRVQCDMPLEGGGFLHCENYPQEGAKAAVVMLHGYTESAEKFREIAYYFLKSGFSVWSYDHRGHGRSLREVEPSSLTHVEYFEQYVRDAESFVEKIVKPQTQGQTLCLFAHSMGGAVGAMLMQRRPMLFDRAVLTAPMISPVTKPLPLAAADALVKAYCAAGKGKQMAFVGHVFDPAEEIFEKGFTTSPARFDYYTQKRLACEYLQNCAPTYAWLREAIGVRKNLLDAQASGGIQTPVLLCQAGMDTVVSLPDQEKFVKLVPGAQLVKFPKAKHEIYISDNSILSEYVPQVIGFLRGPEDEDEEEEAAE